MCVDSFGIGDGHTHKKDFKEEMSSYYDMANLSQYVEMEDATVCKECFRHYNARRHHIPFVWPPATNHTRHPSLSRTVDNAEKVLNTSSHFLAGNPIVLAMESMAYFEDAADEYVALAKHSFPPPEVQRAGSQMQDFLFGSEQYACMHWRFEETKCGYKSSFIYPLGHCMTSSEMEPCDKQGHCNNEKKSFIRNFSTDLMVEAISRVLEQNNISNLFVITDGHVRNRSSVVNEFSKPFGSSFKSLHDSVSDAKLAEILEPIQLKNSFSKVAFLERKVCANANVVLGSATSSFAWEVIFDHAREDSIALAATFQRHMSGTGRYLNGAPPSVLDLGYRQEDYSDSVGRGVSLGFLPDLRPASEKKSNVYYLDLLLARHVERKAIVENNPNLIQKVWTSH